MLYGKSTALIILWRTIELEQWKESLDQWITPPTMHTATRRVSRKAKRSRSFKGVDRLMRLLPFICPFKSSDLKALLLLLGYLLMTFVCDMMIRVSFEVHFPICMFLRFGKAGWDCVKKGYIFMCARYFFFVFKYTVSPAAKKKQRYVSQNLILGILYSLSVFETLYVFLSNVKRDEFGVRRRNASRTPYLYR